MLPKPKHLGPEYGAQFKDDSIVCAYYHRPPYPPEVFETLSSLIADTPRTVLDVGCGTGDVARPLAAIVDWLDAVDFSLGMIERGKRLPGGDRSNLAWIYSSVEEAPLDPPYALITAGESLHWMAWDVVLPRFADVLTPHGVLAIVERNWDGSSPITDRLRPIFRRYSTNRDYQPYDLVAELELRELFHKTGEKRTKRMPWRPTVDEYIECRHSQNGCSRDRMGREADAFDDAVQKVLQDLCREGIIELRDGNFELDVEAKITWGKPVSPGEFGGLSPWTW